MLSECDKLKLRKMYNCDTDEFVDECRDMIHTIQCKSYKLGGKCGEEMVKKICKKTCNSCDECMDDYDSKRCMISKYKGDCCQLNVMKNCRKTCKLCDVV